MLISPAYAQTTGAAAQASGTGSLFQLLFPIILLLPFFYLLILRPQQQRQKKFRSMLEDMKKGDSVVTAGGIVGRVTRVEDVFVEVEIAANTRVRIVKATIAEVTNPMSAKPAND